MCSKKKKVIILLILIILIITGFFYYKKSMKNSNKIEFYGNVEIRDVTLSFRVGGRIKEMKFEEGDKIQANQVIAIIDSKPYKDKVNIAKANLDAKLAIFKNAEISYERAKNVFRGGAGSEKSYDDAKATFLEAQAQVHSAQAKLASAKTSFDDTKLVSPSDGIIISRIREKGAIVQAGQPVYTLSLKDPVWVRIFISEPFLSYTAPGKIVEVLNDSGDKLKGKIGFISPVAEFTPKTIQTKELRTRLVYRARVIVEDPNDKLRQGMPVTVKLEQVNK